VKRATLKGSFGKDPHEIISFVLKSCGLSCDRVETTHLLPGTGDIESL
jgi:hypothetical protein